MAIRGNKYRICLIVAAAVQLCFNRGLPATTKSKAEFICPICNSRVEGYTVISTNTFGGVDRDFLRRAAGEQPIVLLPTTCSTCLYSGYKNDFGPEVDLAKGVKEQILGKGVLKPIVPIQEGTESYDIPACVRYDLIAQTYQLRGKTDEVIANQFLKASWATRMGSGAPVLTLGEELRREVNEWGRSQWNRGEAVKQDNRVLYHIQKGKAYAEAAKSGEAEARMIAAMVAIETLRRYGENTEAQKVLPVLKTVMPVGQYSELERSLNDSIAREQHFQSKALRLFEKVIQTKEDSQEKACLTYLCGELHRRLGNWDKAKFCYKQCLEIEPHPVWLEQWAEEQKGLLPK